MKIKHIKNIVKIAGGIGCISFLIWLTVLIVLSWNDEVDNLVEAGMTVEPRKAILAAGIAALVGILLVFIRNSRICDAEQK